VRRPLTAGREALDRARAIFDHLGATALAAETERLLARPAS